MDFLLFTVSWMALNCILAIIPVFAGMGMQKAKRRMTKILFGVVWLLFLPNTIYLLTDPFHFVDDLGKTGIVLAVISIPLYLCLIVLGVATFILSLFPIKYLLKKKKHQTQVLLAINFLVGFGVTLGRIERINSWEALTNISKTLHAAWKIGTSLDLLLVTLLFACCAQLLYNAFKNNSILTKIYRILLR